MDSRNVDERIYIPRAKRNGIKTQLSLFEKFLREFPDPPNILWGLRCRHPRRTDVFSTFDDLQAELEDLKEVIHNGNKQETSVSSKPPRCPHSNKLVHRAIKLATLWDWVSFVRHKLQKFDD
ncbi:uncharacterized protein LOC143217792 [Lasioglossum baleicum]|uniref:uncharacterized protein LOC143217792 n=1 Tax=Lasioglossum baleicum TaxID=434251 RepID=UPI003FCD26AB